MFYEYIYIYIYISGIMYRSYNEFHPTIIYLLFSILNRKKKKFMYLYSK